jgi:hypothetical protein
MVPGIVVTARGLALFAGAIRQSPATYAASRRWTVLIGPLDFAYAGRFVP